MGKNKVPEEELIERACKVLRELSKVEFIEEVNRILGAAYTIDEIEWEDEIP